MRRPGYPLDRAGAYVFQAFREGYKFTLSESAAGRHNAIHDGSLYEPSTGEGDQRLMLEPRRSDRSLGRLVKTRDLIGARRRQDPESGQATTEFALILFPLLILVAGIIYFGIGLNYWLDMQRLSNQGARWAVVNAWPNCPRTPTTPACNSATLGAGNSLPTYLKSQAVSNGLRSSVAVAVCYPDDGDSLTQTGTTGTPVRVTLDSPFKFVPILSLGTINLHARATMRLEQNPTHIVANPC